jgi:hypothetical protein
MVRNLVAQLLHNKVHQMFLTKKIILMAGRGDNNKKGSAGRGAGNQSSQAFGQAADAGRSNRGEQTGGKRSQPEPKKAEQSSNRNTSVDRKKE